MKPTPEQHKALEAALTRVWIKAPLSNELAEYAADKMEIGDDPFAPEGYVVERLEGWANDFLLLSPYLVHNESNLKTLLAGLKADVEEEAKEILRRKKRKR